MEKKFYFCDELNNVLSCINQHVTSCCSSHVAPPYFEDYKGEKITFDSFYKLKSDILNYMDDEYLEHSGCKGCMFLRERREDDKVSKTFNLINLSHWSHCNCGCIYCSRKEMSGMKITTKPKKSDYYDFLPLLKQLYKHDLLDKENLAVSIQGGDLSVLKEFKSVIKEFLKHGVKKFCILTNNIVYQPIIKELLDKNYATVVASLDCGSRELYQKIKRVDKFDDFITNLKKYLKTKHKNKITVKYILIEQINDNKEEIKKFLDLMSEIGIEQVEFDIDFKYRFGANDGGYLPEHYKDLFVYFSEYAKEKNLNLTICPQIEQIKKDLWHL